MNRTGQFCRPCSAYQSTVSSECHFSLDFRNACSVISPVKQRPISEHTLEIAGTNKRCMSAFWLSLGLSSQKLIAIRNRFCRLLLCREENYLLGPLCPKTTQLRGCFSKRNRFHCADRQHRQRHGALLFHPSTQECRPTTHTKLAYSQKQQLYDGHTITITIFPFDILYLAQIKGCHFHFHNTKPISVVTTYVMLTPCRVSRVQQETSSAV